MKRKVLNDCNVYLILDALVCNYDKLFAIAKKAISAGIDILQLRDKTGNDEDILKFSEKVLSILDDKTYYIINDRIDLALKLGADGVHLGQDDLSIKEAKRIAKDKNKDNFIIGGSCQTLSHINIAVEQGVDYIGFGSVFKTLTKPDRNPMDLSLLKEAIKNSPIPIFAIGGINLDNLDLLQRDIGVSRVAICRAICEAEDIGNVVECFKMKLSS